MHGSKRSTNLKKKHETEEFGGTSGVLYIMALLPGFVLGLFLLCDEAFCVFNFYMPLKFFFVMNISYYIMSFSTVIGFTALIAILTMLPFGGQTIRGMDTKQGRLTYVLNGLFATVVILTLAGSLEYFGFPIKSYILVNRYSLFIASYVCGLVLSVVIHIRSYFLPKNRLNPHCKGKNCIYGFFMGRELNPRIRDHFDLKMFVVHVTLIASILFNIVYFLKHLERHELNQTILLFFMLEEFYLLYGVIFERAWITSFEIQYEGFGYMTAVGYFIYPFSASASMKYLVDFHVELEFWALSVITIIYVVGYIVLRESNREKDAYRQNPNSSEFTYAKSVITGTKKNLLCSGLWGFVRHPNYLGDIMVNFALLLFVFPAPPFLSPLSLILLLLHRSVRDNARCKHKYGLAWNEYCERVKYVLVPNVY